MRLGLWLRIIELRQADRAARFSPARIAAAAGLLAVNICIAAAGRILVLLTRALLLANRLMAPPANRLPARRVRGFTDAVTGRVVDNAA